MGENALSFGSSCLVVLEKTSKCFLDRESVDKLEWIGTKDKRPD